jgi:hypothetical protein
MYPPIGEQAAAAAEEALLIVRACLFAMMGFTVGWAYTA